MLVVSILFMNWTMTTRLFVAVNVMRATRTRMNTLNKPPLASFTPVAMPYRVSVLLVKLML